MNRSLKCVFNEYENRRHCQFLVEVTHTLVLETSFVTLHILSNKISALVLKCVNVTTRSNSGTFIYIIRELHFHNYLYLQ